MSRPPPTLASLLRVPVVLRLHRNTLTDRTTSRRESTRINKHRNAKSIEFNRYSDRKLVVEDTASEELRLSGVFTTDPDFLIRYLRERTDITIVETDSEIRITHRN